MDAFIFPHLSTEKSTAYFALFRNVENASSLRQRVVKVSTLTDADERVEEERDAVNLAFIDARLITSRTHLQTAVHQALLASSTPNGMRTRSVHSEILFYLNPTNNITESFKNFGLSDKSTSLIVVRIGKPVAPAAPHLRPDQKEMQVQELMKDAVIGTIVPLDDPEQGLESITDWAAVRKLFKLNTEPAVKNASSPEEERVVVDRIVTSAVAMKSVMQ
ncbi:CGI-121-domain-containing protein [Coprinellus micaceus]|uniref:EKC/KEOPS complex subunit CGI121 n=1 Tax=Coprinellus micaceus TaxID=71717 RepID=A0A4Y7T479_COPMI|nr:CGI-121-domain-containing protein [Coprinellus micaceus]